VFMFVNIFIKKKKNLLFTMRSIILLYVRLHTWACVQTHSRVFEHRGPHHTHTLSTNAIEWTLVGSIVLVLNPHVTLFRSLSSLSPPHFILAPYSCLHPSSPFLLYPTTQTHDHHHHFTTVHPPVITTVTAPPPPVPFAPIFFSLTNPTFPNNSHFVPFLSFQKHKSFHRLCLCSFCVGFFFVAGGWVRI
jgi:hypothetical protein